MSYKATKN